MQIYKKFFKKRKKRGKNCNYYIYFKTIRYNNVIKIEKNYGFTFENAAPIRAVA